MKLSCFFQTVESRPSDSAWLIIFNYGTLVEFLMAYERKRSIVTIYERISNDVGRLECNVRFGSFFIVDKIKITIYLWCFQNQTLFPRWNAKVRKITGNRNPTRKVWDFLNFFNLFSTNKRWLVSLFFEWHTNINWKQKNYVVSLEFLLSWRNLFSAWQLWNDLKLHTNRCRAASIWWQHH